MGEERKVATALQYNEGKDQAPKVIAKGQGEIAERIEEIAKQHEVPTYQDEKLARQLYNLAIGDEIPPELYSVVAEILAFIITLDTREGKAYDKG